MSDEESTSELGVHPLVATLLAKMANPRKYVAPLIGSSRTRRATAHRPRVLELRADELSPIAKEAPDALEASAEPADDWSSF